MKEIAYLIIGKTGIRGVRKTKPDLKWDEVACRIELNVPDSLFERPQLEATIKVKEELLSPNYINPELIINTKELIEQQTGAKIDMKVISYSKEEKDETD